VYLLKENVFFDSLSSPSNYDNLNIVERNNDRTFQIFDSNILLTFGLKIDNKIDLLIVSMEKICKK
jgi:hypothetical protein